MSFEWKNNKHCWWSLAHASKPFIDYLHLSKPVGLRWGVECNRVILLVCVCEAPEKTIDHFWSCEKSFFQHTSASSKLRAKVDKNSEPTTTTTIATTSTSTTTLCFGSFCSPLGANGGSEWEQKKTVRQLLVGEDNKCTSVWKHFLSEQAVK